MKSQGKEMENGDVIWLTVRLGMVFYPAGCFINQADQPLQKTGTLSEDSLATNLENHPVIVSSQ